MVANAPFEDDDADSSPDLFEHHQLTVDAGQAPLRIDKFIFSKFSNYSRNKIQAGIDYGYVLVNGQQVKVSYKVRPLDAITIALPEPPRDNEVLPENLPLNIVFEDDQLLVVNKAAGMVVHPAHNNWSGTLVNGLVHHFNNLPTLQNGSGRPGLVHRLDKDTSGLLVIAKTDRAMVHLARQFHDHTIERNYRALVWGVPAEQQGTIKTELMRSPTDRRIMQAVPPGSGGKHAITHYNVLETIGFVTLVGCRLETGRTHQIRAHMRHLGHPVFSDATYGGNRLLKGPRFSKYKAFVDNCFKIMPRQALHARTLGFVHPTTGKKCFFEADLPADFEAVLQKWRHFVNYGGAQPPSND